MSTENALLSSFDFKGVLVTSVRGILLRPCRVWIDERGRSDFEVDSVDGWGGREDDGFDKESIHLLT